MTPMVYAKTVMLVENLANRTLWTTADLSVVRLMYVFAVLTFEYVLDLPCDYITWLWVLIFVFTIAVFQPSWKSFIDAGWNLRFLQNYLDKGKVFSLCVRAENSRYILEQACFKHLTQIRMA